MRAWASNAKTRMLSTPGEVAATEWPGAVVLDRDQPEPSEWQHQTGDLCTSCLAMMMRWISLVPSPMHINGASR